MEMQQLGYNYRLTDFQSALGISQLKRAEEGLNRRREIAKYYNDSFKEATFTLSHSGFIEGHAYHLYVLNTVDRIGLYNFLRENNIYCQIHYIPIHLMPYYRQFGWKEGDLPEAEKYYKSCISLPMYPTLSYEDQTRVIDLILNYK
jgi:dTDP-4-amino-4,6-dideoxygalactose transaminase